MMSAADMNINYNFQCFLQQCLVLQILIMLVDHLGSFLISSLFTSIEGGDNMTNTRYFKISDLHVQSYSGQ